MASTHSRLQGTLPHALLLFCLLNLLFIVYHRRINDKLATARLPVYSYRGHDYPPTLPLHGPHSHALLTVEDSVNYPLLGFQSDPLWFSLSDAAEGYVRLQPDPSVPKPDQSRIVENRLFGVTVFHELHCLRLLNLAFDPSHVVGDHHIQHCLGYLKQMALCDADLTLEPAGWTDGKPHDVVGATHVCRDWEMVYASSKESWKAWIGSRS
ncbi:hypothetical protein B0H11DRAFT_1820189 [Mycena galericulata]|nr:hypothetical protein B0H11DRAFT_1820189 [Mycena galericulata]